jgi:tetratricopeptide (TPR) repeat protein
MSCRFTAFVAIVSLSVSLLATKKGLSQTDSLRQLYFSAPSKQRAEAAYKLAESFLKTKSYDSAFFYVNVASGLTNKNTPGGLVGNIIKLKGNVKFRQNKPLEAIEFYKEALPVFEKAGDKDGVEAIYNNIGIIYGMVGETAKSVEYLEKSAQQAAENGNKISEAKTLHNIGYHFEKRSEYDKALEYYFKALKIKREHNDKESEASTLNNIGNIYFYTKLFEKALDYYDMAYKVALERNDSSDMALRLSNVGMVLKDMGRGTESIQKMIESLAIYEKRNDIHNIARVYTMMGNILSEFNDYDRSLEYFTMALRYYLETSDLARIGHCYFNIGNVQMANKNNHEAILNINKALEIFNKLDLKKEKLFCYNNLVASYSSLKSYTKALAYADSAILISNSRNDTHERILTLLSKTKILLDKGQTNEALTILRQAEDLSKVLSTVESDIEINLLYKRIYSRLGDYGKALSFYENYVVLKDSVNNLTIKSEIADIERRYQLQQKDKEIGTLTAETEYSKRQIRNRNILLILSILIVLSLLFSTYVVFRAYRSKKRLNEQLAMFNAQIIEQSEEIRAQRDDIEQKMEITQRQKNILVRQKKAITDSLNYAQYIQLTILPNEPYLQHLWNDFFILHIPKDIVSGDFYWAAQYDNIVYAAAIDCTGHGVPGAFMSLMVYNALHMATNEHKLRNPDEVIAFADNYIGVIFSRNKMPHQPDNGMDMALCAIDKENGKLHFAGARMSAFLLSGTNQNHELAEIKGDTKSAGTQIKPNFSGYKTQTLNIQPEDVIYLMSDGFADQFGGNGNEKFKRSRIKDKLLQYSGMTLNEQKIQLQSDFYNWKGTTEQTDDVLIIGIKI